VAAALITSSAWSLGVRPDGMLLVAAAAGAFLVYTVDRSFGPRPEDVVNRRGDGREYGALGASGGRRPVAAYILLLAALLALVLILIRITWQSGLPLRMVAAGAVAGALGLWYALPTSWSLKRMLGRARSPVIAAVWGVGVVLLPALSILSANPPGEYGAPGEYWAPAISLTPVLLLAVYRTLWLLPNVLAAEYVDRVGDIHAGNPGLTASWSRQKLYRVLVATGGAAVLVGGATAAWLAMVGPGAASAPLDVVRSTLPGILAFWLALDLAGLAAQILLVRPQARLDGRRVFELDLLAMWPVLPATLFLI